MYKSVTSGIDPLRTYLDQSSSINTKTLILGEWNLNIAENIDTIGNYYYNHISSLTNAFVPETSSTANPLYYGSTDSNVSITGGLNADTEISQTFVSQNYRNKFLFSLEDCFGRFRPRSGINKLVYFNDTYYADMVESNITTRPRFYPADKNDKFKYWTSYRQTISSTGKNVETGISGSDKVINDTVPFIVYNAKVPANRIVLKIQTNVGSVDLSTSTFSDPFYGDSNKAVPTDWKLQYLSTDGTNTWTDLTLKDSGILLTRDTFPVDGYLELAYGIINFPSISGVSSSQIFYAGKYANTASLPVSSIKGYTYLIEDSTNTTAGTYYVWDGVTANDSNHTSTIPGYYFFTPTYGWYVKPSAESANTDQLTTLVNPPSFGTTTVTYRNFQYIKGLRLIINKMNKIDCTFNLIEMSPRLAVDLTDKTMSVNVKKSASDLGITGMPVGQLLASTGSLKLFDYDLAFASYNTNSILNITKTTGATTNLSSKNLQIKAYDIIYDNSNVIYTVPIKTLYAENFPQVNTSDRTLDIQLRDLYFYFESLIAPETLITNQYLSYLIAMLMDSIGFTNYQFKKVAGEIDPVIPYFFIGPNTSVAQVLNDLAVSTQTAMFFDETNVLTLMSKDYIMPSTTDRTVDLTLRGSIDSVSTGVYENQSTSANLTNIISIDSQNNEMYNDGKIAYTTRYIQRSTGTISEQSFVDVDRSWIYKPVLLWEVSPEKATKSINDEVNDQSGYSLSAIALNTDLSTTKPNVVGGVIKNNVMDFGESIYWLSRYNGYFYANGEVIKYDAVEYSVAGTGNVWITSVQDYQKYFSNISFNGKMYPTGKVRIYSEPYYDATTGLPKDGEVFKHGRGQFGTQIVAHSAGLTSSSTWLNDNYAKVCKFDSNSSIFNGGATSGTKNTAAGVYSSKKPLRSGFIKNNLSSIFRSEDEISKQRAIQSGTVQSSALVLSGSSSFDNPYNYISYVYKQMDLSSVYFGTRLRIVGETSADSKKRLQTPRGSTTYYTVDGKNIGGAGGGVGIMVNPNTNNGYYFEIAALTDLSINAYSGTDSNLYNVFFYKVQKSASNSNAVPIVLYKGTAPIIVNDGTFVGQSRVYAEKNVSVYDLAVEYEYTSFGFTFYLYINNKLVAQIDDSDPLKYYNYMSLFVRGSSKLMFENVYALNYALSKNTDEDPVINTGLNRYSINPAMQSTYLKSISSVNPPDSTIYYEEFGTIMREMAYFNIRYDKAYPAFSAKIAPTFNNVQGYSVSGFTSTPYGAEFLIFNTTDTVLNLDETSGNYLRILGITFTQQSENQLTVDDYLSKMGDFANPQFSGNKVVMNNKIYSDIKVNRLTYGKKEFSINAPYIQTQDSANNLMGWLLSKVTTPKRSLGITILADPTIQLGDLLTVDYVSPDGLMAFSSDPTKSTYARFIVYSIETNKSISGPTMTIYVSEVI